MNAKVLMFSAAMLLGAMCWCPGAGAASWGELEGLAGLKDWQTMRSSSSDPNWRNGNWDARPIPPGETLVLAQLEGPGIIRHFWNTIASQEMGYSRLLVLRMYWDGEENPSVECPIGDFFGVGHGIDAPFTSLPVRVSSDGRARNCYWPMPFRKSARITVTNEGEKPTQALYWYIDWHKVKRLKRNTAYFHASYRQEFPTVMGRNYLIADLEGRGHYVGTVQSVRQHKASWWGEGDDFFFIDGEEEPSLRGTGSEDYFCEAWGLRHIDGPFYGVPVMEGYDALNRTTCYRWHIADPAIFRKSLRVEIEHKGVEFNEKGEVISGFEEREDDFSTVAFWYQTEPHKPFPELPHGYARLYYDPKSLVEAEASLDRVEASAGNVAEQQGAWSGGGQVFWTAAEADQWLTVPFEVEEDGIYQIVLFLTHSYDYGIFQIELDGAPLMKPLDLYNSSVTTHEHALPPQTLSDGRHTLTFRNVGTSDRSKGYYFGLDAMRLSKQNPPSAQ